MENNNNNFFNNQPQNMGNQQPVQPRPQNPYPYQNQNQNQGQRQPIVPNQNQMQRPQSMQYQNQNAVPQQPIFNPQPAPTQPVSTKYVPQKKSKKPIIIISIVSAILIIAIAVTCIFVFGKNTNNGTFDIDTIANNIVIDGQHFKMNSTLNDLGSEWDWGSEGPKTQGTEGWSKVAHNGEDMFACTLMNYDETKAKDSLIYGISPLNDKTSICGLKLGNSKETVIKKLGKAESSYKAVALSEDGKEVEHFYYRGETNYKELEIIFLENKIWQMNFTYRIYDENMLPITTMPKSQTDKNVEPTSISEPAEGFAKADLFALAKDIEIDGYKLSLPATIGELKSQGWNCFDTIPTQDPNFNHNKLFYRDENKNIGFDAVIDDAHPYDYSKELNDNIITKINKPILIDDSLPVLKIRIANITNRQEFLNSFDGTIQEVSGVRNGYNIYQYTLYDINDSNASLNVTFKEDEFVAFTIDLI